MGRINGRARYAGVVAVGILAMTACGGSGKSSATSGSPAASSPNSSPRSTGAPAPGETTSAASSAASGGASGPSATANSSAGGSGDCGDAAVAVDKAVGISADVTNIELLGGCTQVSIATALAKGPAGVAAALAICDKAADAAYKNGVGAVSVVSIEKKELAVGIKGSPCIGEP